MRAPNRFETLLAVGLSAAVFTGCQTEEQDHGQYKDLGQKYGAALDASLKYCEGSRQAQERRIAAERIGDYAAERSFVIDEQDIELHHDGGPTQQSQEFNRDFPTVPSLRKHLDC